MKFWGLTNTTVDLIVEKPEKSFIEGETNTPQSKNLNRIKASQKEAIIQDLDFPTGDVLKCDSEFEIPYENENIENTTTDPLRDAVKNLNDENFSIELCFHS